jgi:hypothetical protein
MSGTENLEQLMDALQRVKRLPLEKVQELRTGDLKLSFGQAWELARQQHPSLFDSEDLPIQ